MNILKNMGMWALKGLPARPGNLRPFACEEWCPRDAISAPQQRSGATRCVTHSTTELMVWSYVEDVRTFCANAANEDELNSLHSLMNESRREAA